MNSFGNYFRISIWGESHGKAVGITIDGCPPGIELSEKDFETDLGRRRSGALGTTPRIEPDEPNIVSGVYKGFTTGAPISVMINNTNTKSEDYQKMTFRPGHADFVANKKFDGFNDHRGGGHFSGRLTVCLVIAGVIAKKIIPNFSIEAKIKQLGCSSDFNIALEKAISNEDSIGGIIECKVSGLPIGIGEPFFDSIESVISHLAFSIPAIKGIEFGCGFMAARMLGSEHNDSIIDIKGKTSSNNAGGINGGITNGNDIIYRVVVKPTSSIGVNQRTFIDEEQGISDYKLQGRHDACIALRVPVILESISAIALVDGFLKYYQKK